MLFPRSLKQGSSTHQPLALKDSITDLPLDFISSSHVLNVLIVASRFGLMNLSSFPREIPNFGFPGASGNFPKSSFKKFPFVSSP